MTKRLLAWKTVMPLGIGCVMLCAGALPGCGGGQNPGDESVAGAWSEQGGAGATSGAGGDTGAAAASGLSGSGGTDDEQIAGSDSGGAGATDGESGASAGGTTTIDDRCAGTAVTTQKRVVRLTDNQLVTTYAALFGEAAVEMFSGEEILPPAQRSFPPLATVGTTIGQSAFDLRDRAAQRAMSYVGSSLAELTPCGAEPDDSACGLGAVLEFAESAYRRPLTSEETASYETLWTELTSDNGGDVAEAIRFGFDAVLLSPGFLYRTETGGDWSSEGELDSYELASELSYFLTDGPPDAALLASAETGTLVDKDVVRAHAQRLLETQEARQNLESALIGYFQLTTVPGIVIDETTVPDLEVTSGLLNSMYREGEEFIRNTIWAGSLGELVTSRRTWINSQLAPIYGVAPTSTDANVFSEIMLDEGRSGLLTLSPFLTSKSRPDGTSVVGRGLAVNAALVCSQNPPFPEDDTAVSDAIAAQEDWTEKQKADFRADPAQVACSACHRQFDAMGLVLENYDAVGRHRTTDPMGNPIDTAWTTGTLPPAFAYDQDGDAVPDPAVISGPASLAEALLRTEPEWGTNALTRCMTMNFLNFALVDESQGSARAAMPEHPTNSCAVRAVTDAFETSEEKSFSSLIAEIAASDTLSVRAPGM